MANADCVALKQTLNEYLTLLEKYKDFELGLILSRTAYYGDKMLTHARLARIERKLGNEGESGNQMKLAVVVDSLVGRIAQRIRSFPCLG